MTKQYEDADSILASVRGGFDVSPSASELDIPTVAIMVTEDDITITGKLIDQDVAHTTAPLKAGILYPMRWKIISSVSSGAVKGYY